MLKRATTEDFKAIKKLCAESVAGLKIICQLTAYGFERDFLEAWVMFDDNELTAALVRFYDDISLVSSEEADFEQIQAFLGMFYYNSVMCSESLCSKLGMKAYCLKNAYRFNGGINSVSAERLCEDDFCDAYSLISREIPGSFKSDRGAYLSFLSDYTFRERRLLARGVCTHCDGKLSSVAITAAETERRALISGVACDGTLQKRGLGKKTVLSLVSLLKNEGKESYVIALNESAEGFYEHIGFGFTEKIAFFERKNDV